MSFRNIPGLKEIYRWEIWGTRCKGLFPPLSRSALSQGRGHLQPPQREARGVLQPPWSLPDWRILTLFLECFHRVQSEKPAAIRIPPRRALPPTSHGLTVFPQLSSPSRLSLPPKALLLLWLALPGAFGQWEGRIPADVSPRAEEEEGRRPRDALCAKVAARGVWRQPRGLRPSLSPSLGAWGCQGPRRDEGTGRWLQKPCGRSWWWEWTLNSGLRDPHAPFPETFAPRGSLFKGVGPGRLERSRRLALQGLP